MIAVIRLRGSVKLNFRIKDTLKMLYLKNVNNCIVLPENGTYQGALQKIKDMVTFGQISKEVFKKMLLKRGEVEGNKKVTEEYLKQKNYTSDTLFDAINCGKIKLREVGIKIPFRLHPPKKGLKSIKKPFSMKGDLGNRREKINELLERMI